MEPIDYLKILQHRWRLIVVCALLAMLAGWALAPAGNSSGPTQAIYQADVTMISNGDSEQPSNLGLAAFLATRGDVAKLAAKTLKYTGDPMTLAGDVTATPVADLNLLTVSATGNDQKGAVAKATAFADATVDFMADSATTRHTEAAAAARAEAKQIQDQMDGLRESALRDPNGSAAAQLEALQNRYEVVYQRALDQEAQAGAAASLSQLGEPTVTQVSGIGGISAPSSRIARMLLVGLVGLALGIVAALVMERLDTRLRTAAAIAGAFGMPVIAEIPKASRHLRHHEVAVVAEPAGGLAESYRSLRSALLLMARQGSARGAEAIESHPRASAQVLLVTSPRAGDGKSSTVANLAAALAEAGRSVLVLDCDFRNPEAHRYLDVQPGIGLSDLLAAGRAADLTAAMRQTGVPHVRLITSGTATSHPASLLLRVGSIIERARSHADVILLDSAPLLTINDTTDLVQQADAVLVVTRSGRINADQAARVTQLLGRASTPVLGIAVIGTPAASGGRSGHRAGGSSSLRSQPWNSQPAGPSVFNRTRVRMGRWVRQKGRRDPLDVLDDYGAAGGQPAAHDSHSDAGKHVSRDSRGPTTAAGSSMTPGHPDSRPPRVRVQRPPRNLDARSAENRPDWRATASRQRAAQSADRGDVEQKYPGEKAQFEGYHGAADQQPAPTDHRPDEHSRSTNGSGGSNGVPSARPRGAQITHTWRGRKPGGDS